MHDMFLKLTFQFSAKITAAVLLCFIVFCGCEGNHETEKDRVNAVIYNLIKADNNSDLNTVLNSYTDSIEFYSSRAPFTKGIENVKVNYEALLRENKLSIATKIIETKVFEHDAIVTGVNFGTIQSFLDSTSQEINDKYIALLVRTKDGEWKINKLIWTNNQ